ncbi:MAG: DUF3365 domain-containing protein [Spongiibacteraceae bacterium]
MQHIKILFSVVFLLFFSTLSQSDSLPRESELQAEAIDIVKTFSETLKPKLKQAIQSGGLEHAIKICSVEAPRIASSLSDDTGWSVKRVSLKPRNTSTAAPDAFEIEVLNRFNELQISGEAAPLLEYSEFVDDKFRYMKAQAVEGICLGCHGSSIPPGVKNLLKEYYPDDVATGYSLGEVRGAFSLAKDL